MSNFPFSLIFTDQRKYIQTVINQKFKKLELSSLFNIKCGHITGHHSISLSLDPNETFLLSGSSDGLVSLYNLAPFQSEIRKSLISFSKCCSVSTASTSSVEWYPHDSGCFASSSFNGTVSIYDAESFTEVESFDLKSPVYKIKFHPDGNIISTCLTNSTIGLCDLRTGDCMNSFSGHASAVTCVDWSPSSTYLMTSSSTDGKILTWDIRKTGNAAMMLCFDWQQDHTVVAKPYHSSSKVKRVMSVDVTSYRKLANFGNIRAHEAAIMSLKYTRCGRYIISCGNDKDKRYIGSEGLVRCWESKDGTLLPIQYDIGCSTKLPYEISIANFSTSASDDVLISPNSSNTIALTKIHSKGKPFLILNGHLDQVTSVVYRSSHQQIVSASKDGLILVWSSKITDNT